MEGADRYIRAVEQNLECPAKYKKALISGLREEIDARFCDDRLSYTEIVSAIGEPADAARELMSSVPETEIARYKKRWLRAAIIAGVVLLIAALIFAAEIIVGIIKSRTMEWEIYISDPY